MKPAPLLLLHRRLVACIGLLLVGCAGIGGPTPGSSRSDVESWGRSNGYQAEPVVAPPYRLFSLLRQRRTDPVLIIYIEHDGTDKPSVYKPRDPTPKHLHALELAHRDPMPMVAYLARPCQFREGKKDPQCDSQLFIEPRYSAEVLDSMNAAVDELKRRSGAERIGLVGYAGGGIIATLLAGRRSDVSELITVVAPLALTDWAATYRVTPFWSVLDPIDQPVPAENVRTTHFVGAKDEIVPNVFTATFVAKHGGKLIYIDDFDHDCCWTDGWPWLLERARGEHSEP